MAGKSKIVEALAELPDDARRWVSGLQRKLHQSDWLDDAESRLEEYLQDPIYIEKLTNIANEFPEAFRQYEAIPLNEAIQEAADGFTDLAIMDPENFRMLAARDIEKFIKEEADWAMANPDEPLERASIDSHLARIRDFADMFESGHQFDEVPFLEVETNLHPLVAQIVGHQGRHRNLAQKRIGANKGLVRILPQGSREKAFEPAPELVSDMDPKAVLHTELSHMQTPEEGGGKSYKKIEDVMKFLSMMGFPIGALGDITETEGD
jgi:hypothetical protein